MASDHAQSLTGIYLHELFYLFQNNDIHFLSNFNFLHSIKEEEKEQEGNWFALKVYTNSGVKSDLIVESNIP